MSGYVSKGLRSAYLSAASARNAAAIASTATAAGNVYGVAPLFKTGKVGTPDRFSTWLSASAAEARKSDLESMNPGRSYVITNMA